jgi:hypothetical protein
MRVPEPIHEPRGDDRILHRLVRLGLQVAREVQVVPDRRRRVYQILRRNT